MESRCVSLFLSFFLFFPIQRYHLHDYPSIFPRSRVDSHLLVYCHSGCSLRNTWSSNSGHNRFLSRTSRGFRDTNDSSRTRCCSLSWHDDSTNGRDTLFLLFFLPPSQLFPSAYPSLSSIPFSLVSFLHIFSSLFFFIHLESISITVGVSNVEVAHNES